MAKLEGLDKMVEMKVTVVEDSFYPEEDVYSPDYHQAVQWDLDTLNFNFVSGNTSTDFHVHIKTCLSIFSLSTRQARYHIEFRYSSIYI